MRRMISDVMQRQIKNLFESASTDADENVEISKRLTVDGDIRVKDFDDYKTTGGVKLIDFTRSQAIPTNHLIKITSQTMEIHMQAACLYKPATTSLLEARNKVFGLTMDEIPVHGFLVIDNKVCTPLTIKIPANVDNVTIRYVDSTGNVQSTGLGPFGTVEYFDTPASSAY